MCDPQYPVIEIDGEEIEVTLDLYHTAYCVLTMDGLRQKGLIQGGPEIRNREGMQAIHRAGTEYGFPCPTASQIRDHIIAVRMLAEAGEL